MHLSQTLKGIGLEFGLVMAIAGRCIALLGGTLRDIDKDSEISLFSGPPKTNNNYVDAEDRSTLRRIVSLSNL